jgi:hypothetical protein
MFNLPDDTIFWIDGVRTAPISISSFKQRCCGWWIHNLLHFIFSLSTSSCSSMFFFSVLLQRDQLKILLPCFESEKNGH